MSEVSLERLEACLLTAAELMAVNPLAEPLFTRLDEEVRAARAAMEASDPVSRARAMIEKRRRLA